MNKPKLISGNYHFDNRGSLFYFNQLSLSLYKRFYDVENYQNNFIRAWHGHKKESKLLVLRKGAALVGVVKINDWAQPSKKNKIYKFYLDERSPQAVIIPKGYANGFMNLKPNTLLTFYSDKSLKESSNDDFRYKYDYWDIWQIDKR
ncbi:dTDP-4-dehydrorhamnose 3,5-epimerase family protein [Alphaproteobacteria bacterium]|nr:dTDP-4-dehydrorhamnose 3,5-epimerase family protein [Alphaproteobacteria bacterium]